MRFLIVGASGFIGGTLLAHARAKGFEVVGTQAHGQRPDLSRFDLARDRIVDCVPSGFFAGAGPIHVVIAAAISDMDRCLRDGEASRQVNVDGTIRLIEDVRSLGAKPVFLSTCFVFDGKTGGYTDDATLSPVNEYGRHKATVEQYIRARVPEALVARLSTNVGDTVQGRHLFADWHKLILAGQPIPCIEGSSMSPTYVEDVARAIVLGCQLGLTGVFNVAGPEPYFRDELAQQFGRALGRRANVVTRPLADFGFADNRALRASLDSSRFADATGLRFTPMVEVIQKFVRRLQGA